ncbi:MAG: GTP cyclohydrolase II [Candidatus Micrarchaeota archaeon]
MMIKSVDLMAKAKFPTKFGEFTLYAFQDEEKEHIALVRGCNSNDAENTHLDSKDTIAVPVRIHSKCVTGDTFSSLRCDCNEQLEQALEYLGKQKNGVLIYLDQEGRGIGLCNKIKAYELQDEGMDTVDANLSLGFAEDLRGYDAAVDILRHLGIKKIRLITNNPQKIEELKEKGIDVVDRIPAIIKPGKHNKRYLETKKEKMEHMLD